MCVGFVYLRIACVFLSGLVHSIPIYFFNVLLIAGKAMATVLSTCVGFSATYLIGSCHAIANFKSAGRPAHMCHAMHYSITLLFRVRVFSSYPSRAEPSFLLDASESFMFLIAEMVPLFKSLSNRWLSFAFAFGTGFGMT